MSDKIEGRKEGFSGGHSCSPLYIYIEKKGTVSDKVRDVCVWISMTGDDGIEQGRHIDIWDSIMT